MLTSRASLCRLRNSRFLSSGMRSRVKTIGSDEAYSQITTEGTGRKAIVYFTAKWCPPCKKISPIYDELSAKHKDIDFAKLDIDELNETTSKAGVRSMPTFFCFKDDQFSNHMCLLGGHVVKFSGADEELLRKNAKQLSDL